MIDRYSRPAMKQVWSDENKYRMWLDVELAVCEAWTEAGVIPDDDMATLRTAAYNHQRMMEIFDTTRHDVTAFLRSITETLGPEGRWLHLGMTSSDMLDTGQAFADGCRPPTCCCPTWTRPSPLSASVPSSTKTP